MRNANWTRILTILLSLLALYALLAVLAGVIQRFITPILLLILASLIAFVLTPVVDFFQRRLKIYRWLSILTTYLMLVCVLSILGYFMASPLIDQTKALTSAIKNPSAADLRAVGGFQSATGNYLKAAVIYQTDVAQTKTTLDPTTGSPVPVCLPGISGECIHDFISGQLVTYPQCYAAYFLKAMGPPGNPTLVWSGGGCGNSNTAGPGNRIWDNWRYAHSVPHPFQSIQVVTKLNRLTKKLDLLSHSSVQAKLIGGRQSSPGKSLVPTTQVPASYSKPSRTILATLVADVHLARSDVLNQNAAAYAPDANRILRDAQTLAADAKTLYRTVKSSPIIVMAFQNFFDQHHIPINVGSAVGSAINKVRGQTTTVLNNAVSILTGTLNVIFDGIVILIMSLYLLADGGRFIAWLMRLVPEAHREQAAFFLASMNRVLGGYVRGQLIVAITIGILAGLGCWAIGVPYALLLGIFAFLAESIPVMGPIIASVPAILVALFTISPLRTVFVVIWFIVIQQIEQNVVGPRITGHAVGIHPVVAMVAVIVGLEIGGIWGAFLAVPVAGILFVMVGEAYSYVVLRQPLSTAEIPESLDLEPIGTASSEGGG